MVWQWGAKEQTSKHPPEFVISKHPPEFVTSKHPPEGTEFAFQS